jgi:hypothetical protein
VVVRHTRASSVAGAPWDAWSALASADWKHTFAAGSAEELCEVGSLEQADDGSYTWVSEAVYRTHTGLYLFTRAERREGAPDTRVVLVAATPDELVTTVKGQLGMPPVRLEVLGRAGIEIGLLPDDELEGDELEGPIPD